MSKQLPPRPPRKWELWVAVLLIVAYMGNISAAADEGMKADPINDLFLFVGIGWLVAIWFRLRKYKRSRGDQS